MGRIRVDENEAEGAFQAEGKRGRNLSRSSCQRLFFFFFVDLFFIQPNLLSTYNLLCLSPPSRRFNLVGET